MAAASSTPAAVSISGMIPVPAGSAWDRASSRPGSLRLGHHHRGHCAGVVGDHGHVFRMPGGTPGIDPDDGPVPACEPASYVVARGRLGLRRDRVLKVKHDSVGPAGERLGEPVWPVPGHEQECPGGGDARDHRPLFRSVQAAV